jgi:antitoxin HicB
MRAYPATLTPDPDGGFTVTFRDVPEAITEGDSREEALLRAEDALESALAMYVTAKEPLPAPSAAEADEVIVPLSALGMAKAALYEAMREQGVGRADLARRLRWHLPQVARVLDLRHASKMEQVEAALAALGLRLIVDVARAA